jgi:hypothetical protein
MLTKPSNEPYSTADLSLDALNLFKAVSNAVKAAEQPLDGPEGLTE